MQAVAGSSGKAPRVTGADIAGAEPWHRGASGNNLRAAVLGANDGLVSNFCLIMGVAGAGTSGKTVLLTGMAGLIAGACCMALGEWLSVTNARELARPPSLAVSPPPSPMALAGSWACRCPERSAETT